MESMSPILFPVDFSPHSRAIIPYVKAMAAKLDAKVILFYGMQIPEGLLITEPAHAAIIDREATISNAQDELRRFYDSKTPNVEAVADIGDPASKIVAYACVQRVSLIMMPTHGYGVFRALLLGSVAAKVLHDTDCPVWTGAHIEESKSPVRPDYQNILCALDLKKGSDELLRRAVGFAARFNAALHIVHAVADPLPGPDVMPATNFHEFLMQAAREELANVQSRVGSALDVCLGVMPVADWVTAVANRYSADLIIIGRGCLQGKLGRLRTSAYSIIRQAPCPVLSF